MAKSSQVCWISGSLHHRKLTLNKLKGQFAGHDILRMGSDVNYAYFEHQIYSSSCFSDKRLLIVDSLPQPSGTKPTMLKNIKKMLENIPNDLVIVFDGIDPKDEKALFEQVKSIGHVFHTPDLVENNHAAAWTMEQFAAADKNITEKDAGLFCATCGFDSSVKGLSGDILRLGIRKICSFMGRRKNVTESDVIINIFPSEEFVIWSIFDAMDSRDLISCHNAFFKLVNDSDGDISSAVHLLFNLSLPRYRMLLFLKESIAKGQRIGDATHSCLSLVKMKATGTNFNIVIAPEQTENGVKSQYSEYGIRSVLHGSYGKKPPIEVYSRRDLVRIFNCLTHSMSELRLRSEANLLLLVDVLFLTICSNVDDTLLEKIRNSL
jgi:hypothetical protein